MSDGREPIIDPLLEELLGDHSPPDLKRQILQAYQAGESSAADRAQPDQEARTDRDSFPEVVARPRRPRRRRKVNWRPWASAAVVLIGAGTFFAWYVFQTNQHQLANQPPPKPESTGVHEVPPPQSRPRQVPRDVPIPTPHDVYVEMPGDNDADPPPQPRPEGTNGSGAIDPEFYANQTSPEFRRERVLEPVSSDNQIVKFTNQQLKQAWKREDISPDKPISDKDWYTRTYRFLTGETPPLEAAQNFARRDRNREKAVASFMQTEGFATTWSKKLADMLVGQFGSGAKSFDREQLETYLRESLMEGKPYDELAFELITAIGSNDPSSEDFNAASNFLLAFQRVPKQKSEPHRAVKKIDATNIVCQVFLGKQLQCAQCHEHPSTGWSQDQFWQMASFFVQMRNQRLDEGRFKLVNLDFTGNRGTPRRAELRFRRDNNEVASVLPAFIDGQPAESQSGIAAEFDRRESLAKMIVRSDDFSKTIVNRLWDQTFGQGFTYPVDDIGEHNQPSHPVLLDRLATEFRNSGYDVRAALRWMTLSSAFELKIGSPRAGMFDAYATRRSDVSPTMIGKTMRQFAESGVFDPSVFHAQIDPKAVTPQQALQDRRRYAAKKRDKLLSTEEGRLLRRILDNPDLTDDDRVLHLFLSILGRRPTDVERKQSVRILKSGDQRNRLQDIGYILINSREFAVQH